MIVVHKEDMNNSFKLIEKTTKNGKKSINSRKNKQIDKENYSRLKNGNISNKNTNRGSYENGKSE